MGITYFRPEVEGVYVSLLTQPLRTPSAYTFISQSLKKAREYCCAIGMRLANFPDKSRLLDAYNAVQYR
jgi:hypothetical protein